MKRIVATFLVISTALIFNSCTPAELQRARDAMNMEEGLTSSEISQGLKSALQIGITKGADQLSNYDGYYKSIYKIFLPAEVQTITSKLRNIPGFNTVEETLVEKVNRAAEDAAKSAKPIFINAITSMTFNDALNILMGADNAATSYLERVTRTQLYNQFNPTIINSLNKFGALDYYKSAVNKYNSLPFVTKLNPKLDDYVTNKALDGLFGMVQAEELKIRKNPVERVTALLKKVFAKQDRK